jgi:hypothetical protein
MSRNSLGLNNTGDAMKINKFLLRAIFVIAASVAPLAILVIHREPSLGTTFDGARLFAWVSCLVGLLGLFVLAGLTIQGRVLGVLIDERNRYSMSRMQIALWTVLILTTLYTVFIANIVRGDWISALTVDLDYNLIGLLGISVASFVTAPLALNVKANQPVNEVVLNEVGDQLRKIQKLSENPMAVGRVLVKNNPDDARLADLIRGEEIGNATFVDLSRLQMLVITAVVLLAYLAAVSYCLVAGDWVLRELPKLSPALLLLVLISHGGYITGKLIPNSSAAAAPSPQFTSRALEASRRAATLAADIQARLSTSVPGEPLYGWLRNSLVLAQSAAADATALLSRIQVSDFKPDEISNVEGRIEALQNSMRTQPDIKPARQVLDAPSADTVRKVQRRLYDLGHNDLVITGIADESTERAIRERLRDLGVERNALHPRPYRFYEEVAQLTQ